MTLSLCTIKKYITLHSIIWYRYRYRYSIIYLAGRIVIHIKYRYGSQGSEMRQRIRYRYRRTFNVSVPSFYHNFCLKIAVAVLLQCSGVLMPFHRTIFCDRGPAFCGQFVPNMNQYLCTGIKSCRYLRGVGRFFSLPSFQEDITDLVWLHKIWPSWFFAENILCSL
jgi:hypothetical protein